MKPELKFEAPRPQEPPASMRFLSESFQPQNGSNGCERVIESYVLRGGGFVLVLSPRLYHPFYGLQLNGSTRQFALLLLSTNSHHEP